MMEFYHTEQFRYLIVWKCKINTKKQLLEKPQILPHTSQRIMRRKKNILPPVEQTPESFKRLKYLFGVLAKELSFYLLISY